jgi:hypothetical protein
MWHSQLRTYSLGEAGHVGVLASSQVTQLHNPLTCQPILLQSYHRSFTYRVQAGPFGVIPYGSAALKLKLHTHVLLINGSGATKCLCA